MLRAATAFRRPERYTHRKAVATLEAFRRPLTEAERRLLQARVGASAERSRQVSRRAPIITIAIVLVLWLLTLLASDAPWWVITGFWALVGGAIWLWVWRDVRKDARFETEWTARLESALRRNTADVFDVRARACVELEEFEDGWVGCSTCQVQWNVPALTPGLDMYLTWREHLYEHIRGVRP